MTTDRVLTIDQVYDLLQLAGTQRSIATLGECPRATLADGSVRFSEAAVLAWIAAGASSSRTVKTPSGASYQHRGPAGPRGGARG
jgi:predicted DNA-binding transcriptional regulator AlpA